MMAALDPIIMPPESGISGLGAPRAVISALTVGHFIPQG